ncbi:NAD-dependent epimerase [Methyloceanibacter sp.]|uniref:NAD-dependent epimerase n=1 Tax=Methyloceanibacter sp. TaxID=1965321 RepID=UPI002D5EF82F|nr:NAD-dependent epimerase [Methyloceanibacter sp.]HZP08410.1 NAD-dependent epimerase [Methyloceanibacter sp.]
MRILVTGAAGFIGYHTAMRLIALGHEVVGFDNLNSYYDVSLKEARLRNLERHGSFRFVRADLADRTAVEATFAEEKPRRVVHLAAQAGVRYSLDHPHAYIGSNVAGFLHILEGCRHHGIEHLVFASSSSVYGGNRALPFKVDDNVDHPLSLYGATKKANELMAHAYAHLFKVPVTGLRFFTVYGPWGRPDMSLFIFTRKILADEPIPVFNHGRHARDFTYIDDAVEGVVRALDHVATPDPDWRPEAPDPATSSAPYRIYNIGNHSPVALPDFIAMIEKATGRKARLDMLPAQPGDVEETYADVEALRQATGFSPSTPLEEGVKRFVAWYRDFYKV